MHRSYNVLVVDDEPSIVRFCRKVLESIGLKVTSAGDGYLAYETVIGQDFDLILADIRLPRMSGIELYTLLIQENPDKAKNILFMTGSVIGVETSRFLNTCKQPYLLKPFGAEQLNEAVSGFLELY